MADLFQDVFDLFGPNKWFWILVVDQNKFIDRRDQLRHAFENASPDPLARDLSEPSLYPLTIIVAIVDRTVIAKILKHLGMSTRAPPRAPAQRFDRFQIA